MNKPNKSVRFPSLFFFLILIVLVCGILVVEKMSGRKHSLPIVAAPEAGANYASTPRFTPKAFVDLDGFYNASLKTNWLGGRFYNRMLVDLPTGVNAFDGSTFRVGGLVQLQGIILKQRVPSYPDSVNNIPVQMTCSKLHFFHGTAWSAADGTEIGVYVIHFEDGTKSEFPIVYGPNLRNWSFDDKDRYQTANAAWSSENRETYFRLYASTWTNSKPQEKITSVDFISLGTDCAPFLLAITVE
jgi:hypothetical protein